MPVVRFVPSGRRFEVVTGASLLRAVVRARLPIGRSCRGTGVCAACRVRVVAGAENLAGMGAVELALAAREGLGLDERFACLARVLGDVTITASYW